MPITKNPIAYVASANLPELPAPTNTRGPIAWVKQNFFSTTSNTILTLISVYIIYSLLSALLPWLIFNSVWEAKDIGQCREINAHGACFAVVVSRFNQLLFGFYPPDQYWRPILTFFMLFAAFAPLLHDNLPRKMLWFTAAFPLLAFGLIWGGSIWVILLIVAMIVLAVVVYRMVSGMLSPTIGMFVGLATILIWLFFIQGNLSAVLVEHVNFLWLEPVETSKFGGFLVTFVVGVTGIVGSLPLGIMLALGRKSDMPTVKMLCVGFIEFIRGCAIDYFVVCGFNFAQLFLAAGHNF